MRDPKDQNAHTQPVGVGLIKNVHMDKQGKARLR